tara:strand:- start:172 stop:504 length:333 start_codon:yes stop_codon:yes gene_type:complete
MPKKTEEWHQIGKPVTPSQINHFFDLCTKWLVVPPCTFKQDELEHVNSFHMPVTYNTSEITFSETDVNQNTEKCCYFCKSKNDVYNMTANPFTRKHQIFVCTKCFSKSDL